jgi:DNA (cytosine-5)-methyltransferase 1
MAGDLLIRNVPQEIMEWVNRESHRNNLNKTEFLRVLLESARETNFAPTLFEGTLPQTKVEAGAIKFRFIDLFAGIGGFRIGLSRVGGNCVFTCEYDSYAQKTYKAWFGEKEIFGDINELDSEKKIMEVIPDHDILAAGFPCQPFSIAGVSKKNSLGLAHGFKDEKQGNLFFKIAEIVKVKRPPVLFLENVKNLMSHDKKRTWTVISSTLDKELNYRVFAQIIDAADYVPQHRERILIVGFDREVFGDEIPFKFPSPPTRERPKLSTILEPKPDTRYTLTEHLWNYLQRYAEKHRKKGNGFGYGLVGPNDQTRTLSARYYKDGSEVLIRQDGGKRPRRLTIREASRLMGFDDEYARFFGHPDGFPQVVSDTRAYKQFGNAVVPNVVETVAREIVRTLWWCLEKKGNGCLLKKYSNTYSSQKDKIHDRRAYTGTTA